MTAFVVVRQYFSGFMLTFLIHVFTYYYVKQMNSSRNSYCNDFVEEAYLFRKYVIPKYVTRITNKSESCVRLNKRRRDEA